MGLIQQRSRLLSAKHQSRVGSPATSRQCRPASWISDPSVGELPTLPSRPCARDDAPADQHIRSRLVSADSTSRSMCRIWHHSLARADRRHCLRVLSERHDDLVFQRSEHYCGQCGPWAMESMRFLVESLESINSKRTEPSCAHRVHLGRARNVDCAEHLGVPCFADPPSSVEYLILASIPWRASGGDGTRNPQYRCERASDAAPRVCGARRCAQSMAAGDADRDRIRASQPYPRVTNPKRGVLLLPSLQWPRSGGAGCSTKRSADRRSAACQRSESHRTHYFACVWVPRYLVPFHVLVSRNGGRSDHRRERNWSSCRAGASDAHQQLPNLALLLCVYQQLFGTSFLQQLCWFRAQSRSRPPRRQQHGGCAHDDWAGEL